MLLSYRPSLELEAVVAGGGIDTAVGGLKQGIPTSLA